MGPSFYLCFKFLSKHGTKAGQLVGECMDDAVGFTIVRLTSLPEQESALSTQLEGVMGECVENCALPRSRRSAKPNNILVGSRIRERGKESS